MHLDFSLTIPAPFPALLILGIYAVAAIVALRIKSARAA